MGNDIKKDYSTSLLSLSCEKRIIGGCPLAFGENNVKGRILNILNYRKPKFWIAVVAAVLVAVVLVGLLSNSQKANLTVEDYANKYIQEEIDMLESFDHPLEGIEANNLKVIDSKITKLELIGTFDSLLTYPIEIWSLEFRLKPDDINNVILAGGMSQEDGWITEYSSMGQPMMVFSYKNFNKDSNPEYLGNLWDGKIDLSNLAGEEIALRIFLEEKGLLPHETFSGNHVLVKFPLSTGETCQMFLSQPVIQGSSGIWWVERWMDGNGTIYYETPRTDKMIINYFEDLQIAVDNGEKQELLDPIKVALDWVNGDLSLGQNVDMDQFEIKDSATVKDFMKTPESSFLGYISEFTTGDNSTPYFHLDQIEWLTLEDADRLRELDIKPNDLPNGYYIYNPNNYPMFHQVRDETTYSIIDWKGNAKQKKVSLDMFLESLRGYSEQSPPYWVVTKDGYVKSITEQYIP